MKERIYISGAITGTDDYMERFGEAQKELESKGYSVINPAKLDISLPEDMKYEEHMKIDIFLLDMCSSIYMLDGWEKSCGANREYGYALAKDMTIIKETPQ